MKEFNFGKTSSFLPTTVLKITFATSYFQGLLSRFTECFEYKVAQLQMAASKFDLESL